MSSYKINRWDVVILPNNNMNKTPMIYIKPDQNFINILNNTNWVLNCKIINTNTKYDCLENLKIYFKNNTNIPNKRKNYFEKTGYICGLLNSEWFGYPNISNLGEILLNENSLSELPFENNLESYPNFKKKVTFKEPLEENMKCLNKVEKDSRINILHNSVIILWIILIINCLSNFSRI